MRLRELDADRLSDEQEELLETIRGSRGRGLGLVGPFGVWLRAPRVGRSAQALGGAVRFGGKLTETVKEVAICTVGAHYRAKFEFAAHRRLALRAGVHETVVESIRVGEEPRLEGDEAVSYAVSRELLDEHRLGDDTYAAAVAAFGEDGLIELVTTIGYYCLISHTLNAFEVPLTDDLEDPFPGR